MSQKMATKTKKSSSSSTTTAASNITSTSTPTTSILEVSGSTGSRSGTPRRSQTPTRPLSPGRMSRIQEKNELQNLNDRLAAYIERVRQLESENSKLRVQIQRSMESREVHTVKTMYEVELNDTRQTLDSIAKEKAQLELELSRIREEIKVAEAKLAKKVAECATLDKRNVVLETQVEDLRKQINQGLAERKRLEAELKTLTEENRNLESRLKSLQKQLEEETILRVDLENRNQSLSEELAFQRQLFQTEMEEVRRKTYESQEVQSEELKLQYEERLKYELDELRAHMEEMIRLNRTDLEDRYQSRISMLQEEITKKNNELSTAMTKIKQLSSSYSMHDSEMAALKSENQAMKLRLEDMSKLLSQEREWSRMKISEKEKEMSELRMQLQQMTEDYNDLLDDKIKLDAELEVYRKLLEGEESRLNMSFGSSSGSSMGGSQAISSSSRSFVPRGVKRKRIAIQNEESVVDYAVTSNATGDVEIADHDVDGKYVRLYNKSDKEIALGGWQLLRKAGDLETRFKFHRSTVIKPQSTVTVWSSDAGTQIHNPPSDIVMKSQTWFTGDIIITTLYNNNNEEVATRKTEKRITSSFHRNYYNNDGQLVENDKNCAIM